MVNSIFRARARIRLSGTGTLELRICRLRKEKWPAIHADRVARGHRDHRHPGINVVAGTYKGEKQSQGDSLRRELEATGVGLVDVWR